jgi:predicted kinase
VDRSPILVLVTGIPGTGKSTVSNVVAAILGSSVLAHDWAMSGLRPYAEIQSVLDRMNLGHRNVGWSILTALARAQLVDGRSVVLDGVARAPQIDQCQALVDELGVALVVIATECADRVVHRLRIEGRERAIPGWYELTWEEEEVDKALGYWEQPTADLVIDTTASRVEVEERIAAHFGVA